MKDVQEASPRQVRFWKIIMVLTWGSLAALLALHVGGVF